MNVEALKALAEAVEAGEFSRGEGALPWFSAFSNACRWFGVTDLDEAMLALNRGTEREFIRALIAQAEKGEV
jgi:hypothetical protein